MNLPNILTVIRILLIPVLMIFYYLPGTLGHLLASIIFAVAAFTDWLDGFIARRLQQITALGKFLDPVADKLIVAVALVLLVGQRELHYLTIPAIVIVCREIAVSALREWMAELGKRASVAVSYVGKVKTALQMVALVMLLYCHSGTVWWFLAIAYFFFYAAAILTLWSMIMYFKAAWPTLISSQRVSA
jgi:CDP-diacylglycerol--glycerol-3-phosphate 3-phosphatidyltransferase